MRRKSISRVLAIALGSALALFASACSHQPTAEETNAKLGVQFVPIETIAVAHDCGVGNDQASIEYFQNLESLRKRLEGMKPELPLPMVGLGEQLALLTFGKYDEGGHIWLVRPTAAIGKEGLLMLHAEHIAPDQARFKLQLKTRPCVVVVLPATSLPSEDHPEGTVIKPITGIAVWDRNERMLASIRLPNQ